MRIENSIGACRRQALVPHEVPAPTLTFSRFEAPDTEALARLSGPFLRRFVSTSHAVTSTIMQGVDLGSVSIRREVSTGGAAGQGCPPAGTHSLGAITAHRPFDCRWCGVPLGEGALVIGHPRLPWHALFPGGVRAVSATFAIETLRTHAAVLQEDVPDRFDELWVVNDPSRGRYGSYLDAALDSLSAAADASPSMHGRTIRALESAILDSIVSTLSDGRSEPLPVLGWNRRRALRAATELAIDGAARLPTVADLCETAGVSRRTLEYSFAVAYGVTPKWFLRRARLDGARRELRAGCGTRTSILKIALEWGFLDPGHFAADYRRAFGESPSDTIRGRISSDAADRARSGPIRRESVGEWSGRRKSWRSVAIDGVAGLA